MSKIIFKTIGNPKKGTYVAHPRLVIPEDADYLIDSYYINRHPDCDTVRVEVEFVVNAKDFDMVFEDSAQESLVELVEYAASASPASVAKLLKCIKQL